jgi:hypothetical protein
MSSPFHKIGWIKRRARRLQRFYAVPRKLAIHDAWMDWIAFQGGSA